MSLHLSPQQAAAELLKRRQARRSLPDWCRLCGFEPARHHILLLNRLAAVIRGEIDRLAIFMPPGAAKSTYTSALFVPWGLAQDPTKSVIAASHTAELAERWGRKVRNLITQNSGVLGYGIATDNQSAGRWATTAGGEYFAAGVGGSVTGRRADIVIIDDPVRSREDADSESMREKTWEWYQADLVTRLKPGAGVILVQTRWHEDDLAGRILEREKGWEVISLPAIAQLLDPLGRAPGEALWPEWEDEDALERKRLIVGPRVWSALYQQNPQPDQGTYYHREWFRRYRQVPDALTIYMSGDFAVTEGDGDFTELAVWGVDSLDNIYALDWWSGQASADRWGAEFMSLIRRWRPIVFVGETGQIRRAVEPMLERTMREQRIYTRLEWLSFSGDKAASSRTMQAYVANGRVYWPETDWADRVIDQMLRFPTAKHDDAVDTAGLFGRYIDKTWSAAPKPAPAPDPATLLAQQPRVSDFLQPKKAASW